MPEKKKPEEKKKPKKQRISSAETKHQKLEAETASFIITIFKVKTQNFPIRGDQQWLDVPHVEKKLKHQIKGGIYAKFMLGSMSAAEKSSGNTRR